MRWGRPSDVPTSTNRSGVWRRWGVAALAAIGLTVSGSRLSAQGNSGTISGKVTDAVSGAPLAGTSVRVGATQLGAQTADDGQYTIRGVPAGTVQLQINRIGYEAKKVSVTVTAGGTTTSNITLSQAAFTLSDVVVTVTGAQKKAEISNTVASVDVAAKAQETTANSLGQLLGGQAAGVQIVSSGAAGAGSRIRIRGQSSVSQSNAPVVYIDGIKVNSDANASGNSGTSRFDDLNPDEIENIDILKGPAAATLYGTEAANGVINITTKRGRAGATRWSFFGETGNSRDPEKGHYRDLWVSFDKQPDGSLDECLLTQVAVGACQIDSTYHNNVLNDPELTPLVNGSTNRIGAQVSGGTDRNQYFVSGEYNKVMGPYKMPQAEISRLEQERGSAIPYNQIYPNADARLNLRANLNSQLGSKADFSLSMGYLERADRQVPNEDNSTGLMVDAVAGSARTDKCDERDDIVRPGSPEGCKGVWLRGYRSYPMGDILAQERMENVNRFTNSLGVRYYPLSWLSARANLGFDFIINNNKNLRRYHQGPYGGSGYLGGISDSRTEDDNYTADLGATATFNPWSQITSKTSVGMQYYRTLRDQTSATGNSLTPGATQVSAGALQSASESQSLTVTFGNYVEEVLSYADKIFLNGGLRYDGNSSFGHSFKGIAYPRVGVSYLISDESFFPQTDWVSSLRLRTTYGASGVQPGTTDAARYFTTTTATINGVDVPGVQLSGLGNSHLKPEYSAEVEAGLDATIFQNRTTVELTYYNKKTRDAIIDRPIAPSLSGITSISDNLGSVRNQGFELTLNNRIIDNANYGFDLQVTGSTNKNRILTLGEGVTPIPTGNRNTMVQTPGYPLFGMWGKPVEWNDANGDGYLAIDEVCNTGCSAADTAVFIGPSFPTKELSVIPRFEAFHRRLAISAQFDHKQGMNKFNNTLRHQSQGGISAQGYWDPNATLRQQACTIAVNNYATYTCMFENGRFTRLREVTVSYQLPDRIANTIRSSRATIVLAGRNLHTWTPYSGVDPEGSAGNSDSRGNEEYFITPPLRYYTIRLNLNF
jgi:TonB-linked SusC/RagA family outer membrane protein